jgi:two-component system sensor histidine kinase/response regulator
VNRLILIRLLESVGVQVHEFESGGAALAWLQATQAPGRPCDLVLLDAQMPDLDGFSTAERIVALPHCAGVPLVMLSSAGLKGDALRSHEIGFSAYLSKPFTRDELLQVVVRVIHRRMEGSSPLVTRHALMDQQSALDILLVEDHVVNQQLAIKLLTRWGHRVTLAVNGQLALEALALHRFDLVLMDMMMPVMDGLEATRRFRASEQGPRTPILAMTANVMPGDRDSCIAAGMDDYISKPLETTELRRLLCQYATRSESFSLDESLNPMHDGVAPILVVSHFDYDLALAQSDQEVVEIIADVFARQWPLDKQALAQALVAGDLQPILHLTHALKGTLAMFGARPPSDLAHRAEVLAARGESAGLAELIEAIGAEVDQLLAALQRVMV